jgi:hypothetical protein
LAGSAVKSSEGLPTPLCAGLTPVLNGLFIPDLDGLLIIPDFDGLLMPDLEGLDIFPDLEGLIPASVFNGLFFVFDLEGVVLDGLPVGVLNMSFPLFLLLTLTNFALDSNTLEHFFE